MVSIVDVEDDSDNDDSSGPAKDIMSAEIVMGKVYTCPAPRPAKGKEKENFEGKVEYSFDISKDDEIFD